MKLGIQNSEFGIQNACALFGGVKIEAKIVRARAQHRDHGSVSFATRATHV